ncbi:MAG: type 1 glutamine amidotransferase [Ignavibacteria bacterium]
MKIHSLHHAPFEGLGCIKDWIDSRKFALSSTFLFESDDLPLLDEFDLLIIMGGPMGVGEEDKYPWLRKEKTFIKSAIEKGKMVLGICLGSQLVAEVLGAKVYGNKFKEIGWFPVTFTKEARNNSFFNFFPDELIVFHWHGDTYDLPPGAIHLAQTRGCKNQGFLFKDRVIGLQFHLEVTPESLNEMIDGREDELVKDTYIQTPGEILSMIDNADRNNRLMFEILDRMEEFYSGKPKRLEAF